MTARHIDTADVAKLIRPVLKQRFPATKFSVTISRYAGGSSIDVAWTDGPTKALVEEAAKHFHGATFDGMTDCKNHHDSELDGERVSFGNDYLFFHRQLSPAFVARVAEEAEQRLGTLIPRTMGIAANTYVQKWGDFASTIIHRLAENRDYYALRLVS